MECAELGVSRSYVCGACNHDTVVVRPRCLVCVLARRVCGDAGAVVYLTITGQKRALRHPVECLLRPLRVCVVPGVHGQPSTKMEQTTVGRRVLVVPSVEPLVDLPSHATSTGAVGYFLVVAFDELVEDGLGHGEPAGLVCGRIWKFVLGCGDHREGPKDLVIVSFVLGLIRGHLRCISIHAWDYVYFNRTDQIKMLSKLVHEAIADQVVVLVVTSIMPVV